MLLLFAVLLLAVVAHPMGPLPTFFRYTPKDLTKAEQEQVDKYVETLNNYNSIKDTCKQCLSELSLGQEIVKKNRDLIPPVFTEWCKQNKILLDIDCETTYGRITADSSTLGVDFANMLSLMNVSSIDGQYYCYYKRSRACELPETPDFDMLDWFSDPPANLAPVEDSGETFNVLHISDHHMELAYKVGAEANCTDAGMCCTPHNYNKESLPDWFYQEHVGNNYLSLYDDGYYDTSYHKGNKISADKNVWHPLTLFGAYECDSPELLVNSSLKSVADFQKQSGISFDFAIFTGDLVDHLENWYTSFEYVVEDEKRLFRDMKAWLGDIPVYSAMGNHDTYPYGQIAPKLSGFRNKYTWNSDLMAELWEDYNWIDKKTAQEVRTHDCGFSVTTRHGLKIISLNLNTYYQKNYYAYWNMEQPDTFGTLRWLNEELKDLEKKGQRVWIMSHIPMNEYDALPLPAQVFSKIIKRYLPTTVAGLFFGHTHKDQFSVLYASNGAEMSDPVNFMWISQSVSPIYGNNPGWRYYEVDKKSFNVMNSHNFYTNLSATFDNNGEEPQWEYLYSAREALDVQGNWPKEAPLNATFWARVAEDLKENNVTASKYSEFLTRRSPDTPDCAKGECRSFHCYATTFTHQDRVACLNSQGLKATFY